MINNTAESAQNWIKTTKHIIVPNDWIEACVEWICEENQDTQQTQAQINNLVYEQWLFADLHELQSKCLPEEVAASDKFQLSGYYALQIDSLVDVGQPYYTQLQKVKGTENPNALVSAEQPTQRPWEPKPTRMLMMKLTDGTTDIQGMEYKPISNLNTQINPGTKILVKGCVLCRHGVLMLRSNSVQILGGEVDTLMENNTQDKLLQQALDSSAQTTGSGHRKEFEGAFIKSERQAPSMSSQRNVSQRSAVSNVFSRNQNQNHPGRSVKKNITEIKQEPEWDDDFVLDEFMEDMDDFEMNQQEPSTSSSTPSSLNSRNKNATNKTPISGGQNKPNSYPQKRPYEQMTEELNIKQEIDRDSDSAFSDGNSNKRMKTEVKVERPKVTVKSEKEMEKKFLANLKPGSFSSSTPLKPFDEPMKRGTLDVFSNKKSLNDRKTFGEKNDLDDFDDDLDDFDMAVAESSLTSATTNNQISTTISPVLNRNSNSSINLNTSDSVQEQSNVKSASKELSDNSIETKSGNDSNKSARTGTKAKLTESTKNDGSIKPSSNTMDKYLTSPPTSVSRRNSLSSPSRDREWGEKVDRLMEKFNEAKSETNVSHTSCSLINSHNEPFTYLSVIMKTLPVQETLKFNIKAYVSTLNGRLECPNGDRWILSCKINDGTATMDVDLSNQVLTMLIGFSSKESLEMRKRIKHDPGLRDILSEGIQQCQQKLIELLCVMEIEVSPNKQKPEVISLVPLSNSHISALYDRVSTYFK